MTRPAIIVLLLLALLLSACSGTPLETPTPQHFTIAGSTSAQPLLAALTAAYHQQHPHISFELLPVGSALGQAMLANGQADLAVSSWLTSTELPGLQVMPIVSDAIIVIVHPRNPVANITLPQLRDIYRARLLDWQEIGGRSAEIIVVSREDGSGTRAFFEAQVMGAQRVTSTALVMPSEQALRAFIAAHPNAIGYASLVGQTSAGADVKTLALEGLVPTAAAYPLIRPIYLLARPPLEPALQEFLGTLNEER